VLRKSEVGGADSELYLRATFGITDLESSDTFCCLVSY
jgi:hypothetical protein